MADKVIDSFARQIICTVTNGIARQQSSKKLVAVDDGEKLPPIPDHVTWNIVPGAVCFLSTKTPPRLPGTALWYHRWCGNQAEALALRRRSAPPKPTRPVPSRAIVNGSGTEVATTAWAEPLTLSR